MISSWRQKNWPIMWNSSFDYSAQFPKKMKGKWDCRNYMRHFRLMFSALDRRRHFLLEMVRSPSNLQLLLFISLAFKRLQLCRFWFESSIMCFVIREHSLNMPPAWKLQIKQSHTKTISRSKSLLKSITEIQRRSFSSFSMEISNYPM